MSTDKEHLQWIYLRMTNKHAENPNVDYMIRFKKIIDDLTECERCGAYLSKDNYCTNCNYYY